MTGIRHDMQEEAISEEEITGTEGRQDLRNAFVELMAKNPTKSSPVVMPSRYQDRNRFAGRNGLGVYIEEPEAFDRVIYSNDKVVFINDMYPKSSVHTLVLPRSSRNLMHPFEAFKDIQFLEETKVEVEKAKLHVANELRRKYGSVSKSEQPRIQARDSDDPPEKLPEGRDWMKEIITGIHAGPSMNHLHVHVMSRDMVSPSMKRRSHYVSFTTPFLVPLEAFPLPKDSPLWRAAREGSLSVDMICWRCGRNFRNKFALLKRHLVEEFGEWKKE